jgi:hypothetical protein
MKPQTPKIEKIYKKPSKNKSQTTTHKNFKKTSKNPKKPVKIKKRMQKVTDKFIMYLFQNKDYSSQTNFKVTVRSPV